MVELYADVTNEAVLECNLDTLRNIYMTSFRSLEFELSTFSSPCSLTPLDLFHQFLVKLYLLYIQTFNYKTLSLNTITFSMMHTA